MTSNPPQDSGDSALDRLLAEALWPERGPTQLARLRCEWIALSHKRTRRLYLLAVSLGAAACLVVATGALMWRARPSTGTAVVAGNNTTEPNRSAAEERIGAPAVDEFKARDPNLYERVLWAGPPPGPRRQRPQQLAGKAPRRRASRSAEGLPGRNMSRATAERRSLFAGLVAIVSGARTMLDAPNRCEPKLWAAVRQNRGFARTSAAELLARVATERSLPVLVELAQAHDTHAVAIMGLVRLANPRDLAILAANEPDAGLRRRLLAALVERGTAESIGLYLNFVERTAMRHDALVALGDVREPPTNVLLSYLRAPNVAQRQAAAQALGRIADPQLALALAAAVDDAGVRKEALVALLLSPTPQAAAALREARQDLYLVASVRAAEFELQSLADHSER